MAATKANLEGYFKEVYETLERATPNWAILQQKVPFQNAKRIGDSYNFPVKLRHSHGITYAGGSTQGTAFALNSPRSLVFKNAQVTGTTTVNQEDIPYDVLAMATDAGEAAFGDSMDEVVFGCREGAHFHTELMLLYGGSNIGVVSGAPTGAGTTRTLTISVADWASGLWAGFENAAVDVYSADGATKRNANADVIVGVVTASARQVTVSGDATDMAAIADTDIIVPKGVQGEWSDGLHQLCTDTGTVHGIDSSAYSLWQANSFDNGGANLTMNSVQGAISQAMTRGLDEKVCCLTSPFSWTDLNVDLAGLRRLNSAEDNKNAKIGSKSIMFEGVTGAPVEIIAHPMVKAGYAYIFPEDKMRRIGASDVTSKLNPEAGDVPENFYQELEGNAGVRIRTYSNQALAAKLRSRLTVISNIVPQSL